MSWKYRHWRHLTVLIAVIASAAPVPAGASTLELGLPLACTPGRDCWISNYVDVEPGPDAKDYRCGSFSYDDHKGTDFALRDLGVLSKGIDVLAAADGTVRGTRDMLPDIGRDGIAEARAGGVECGNGVVLTHDNGWETQYCHLQRGSIVVSPGARVKAGDRLGKVGLSGLTEYPHLHFSVRHASKPVDPFLGREGETCGSARQPLWRPTVLGKLAYTPGTVFNYGILDRKPDQDEAGRGDYRATSYKPDAEAMVLWMQAFAVRPGDRLHLRLVGPGGEMIGTRDEVIEKRQARIFRFFGQRRSGSTWKPGEYRGEITYQPFDRLPARTVVTTARIE